MNLDTELCFANLCTIAKSWQQGLLSCITGEMLSILLPWAKSRPVLSLSFPLGNMILVCKYPKNSGQSRQKME